MVKIYLRGIQYDHVVVISVFHIDRLIAFLAFRGEFNQIAYFAIVVLVLLDVP